MCVSPTLSMKSGTLNFKDQLKPKFPTTGLNPRLEALAPASSCGARAKGDAIHEKASGLVPHPTFWDDNDYELGAAEAYKCTGILKKLSGGARNERLRKCAEKFLSRLHG